MPGTLNLKLITPEGVVFEDQVEQVVARGTAGEFAILPGHEPLVAALGIDVLRFTHKGEEDVAAVLGGLLEVRGNDVTILADIAEMGGDIDHASVEQAKQRAEAEKTQKTDKLDVYVAEMNLGRAMARLKAAEMAKVRRRGRHAQNV
jgi:F-type H+-transporting ATPase subunit epsilon